MIMQGIEITNYRDHKFIFLCSMALQSHLGLSAFLLTISADCFAAADCFSADCFLLTVFPLTVFC